MCWRMSPQWVGGGGLFGAGPGRCGAHLHHGHRHQPRLAVRPVAFVSLPSRGEDSLPQNTWMRRPAARGLADRFGMDRAAVAIKDQIGDGQAQKAVSQKGGPIAEGAGKGDETVTPPEHLIAPVEADAMDICPARRRRIPSWRKNGPCGPCRNRNVRFMAKTQPRLIKCRYG